MENPKELPDLSPEEKLKSENDLLKMKLTAEFGMQDHGTSLDPELENEWLKYIYHFEKEYSEVKRIKIYDFIGRPEYRKFEELKKEEIEKELDRLFEIMHHNNISLDFICEYEDEVIYRFVTEELFEMETDDFRMKGMFHCFLYEEFYPNHDYDIKKLQEEFFTGFFERDWKTEYAKFQFDDNVAYNHVKIPLEDYTNILQAFREFNIPLRMISVNITEYSYSLETKTGSITGEIKYAARSGQIDEEIYSGTYNIRCKFNDFYWEIYEISFPGFN